MAFIRAMSGRCSLCGKRFYAPFGYDQISNVAGSGEPRGVAFEDGRISKDSLGRPCANCLKMLWDWGGPIWADKVLRTKQFCCQYQPIKKGTNHDRSIL
jgi:hypothetical protein